MIMKRCLPKTFPKKKHSDYHCSLLTLCNTIIILEKYINRVSPHMERVVKLIWRCIYMFIHLFIKVVVNSNYK